MVSFLILVDGTIVCDEYSTPARWPRVTFAHTTRIAWCCLFSYFISELRRGGLWVCPQLSSYSWWGGEYNMYCLLTKLYLQLFGRNWCMWAVLLIGQRFSKTSHWCSSYNLSLGSFTMVNSCWWGALSRWRGSWRVFTPPMCMPISFGLGTSTHVCLQSIPDCYIIKQPVSHAWYGCWTIKALVEAEVLYDGFTVSCRCIAAPLIIALGVSLLISNYKTSIKPI